MKFPVKYLMMHRVKFLKMNPGLLILDCSLKMPGMPKRIPERVCQAYRQCSSLIYSPNLSRMPCCRSQFWTRKK